MPRVHDFDPNAKLPPLGSPMDNLPAIQKPKPPTDTKGVQPERPKTPTGQRVMTPTLQDLKTSTGQVVNGSRGIKRHSFEFYKDQVEALQLLALEEKIQGRKGNQSEMVRAAIDEYLQKRKGK